MKIIANEILEGVRVIELMDDGGTAVYAEFDPVNQNWLRVDMAGPNDSGYYKVTMDEVPYSFINELEKQAGM